MKITIDQFSKIMETAEQHFGVKSLNKDRYYDKVRNFGPSIVAEAVDSIMDTSAPLVSKFPTPIALLMACKNSLGRREGNNKGKSHGCSAPGCDSGLVSFSRFRNAHRFHASNPCAHCFPTHCYPQVVVRDDMMFHACRKDGKKYRADFTDLRPIPDTQYLDDEQFVEFLSKGMHRIPGEFVAQGKPKPRQAPREESAPDMVKTQAQEVLKNIIGGD